MATLESNSQRLALFTNSFHFCKTIISYLQRHVWIQLKCRHLLCPWQEFLGLGIDVVIEDSTLTWEFDCLKLGHPPLAELYTVVYQLKFNKTMQQKVIELQWK